MAFTYVLSEGILFGGSGLSKGHSLFPGSSGQGGNGFKDADGRDKQHERLPNDSASQSAGQLALAKCDGPWTVGRHLVNPEEVIAEGGFGVVFLVKVVKEYTSEKLSSKHLPGGSGAGHHDSSQGHHDHQRTLTPKRCALKRVFVNNDKETVPYFN